MPKNPPLTTGPGTPISLVQAWREMSEEDRRKMRLEWPWLAAAIERQRRMRWVA